MAVYDHRFSVLAVSGRTITDWADGADVLQINFPDELGALTKGAGGKAVFNGSGKGGAELVMNLLQNSPDSKFLMDLLKTEKNDLKNYTPVQVYYKDTVNGDEIKLINGWFTTRPNYVRGNAHNNTTWTIQFEAEETNLTEGK